MGRRDIMGRMDRTVKKDGTDTTDTTIRRIRPIRPITLNRPIVHQLDQ